MVDPRLLLRTKFSGPTTKLGLPAAYDASRSKASCPLAQIWIGSLSVVPRKFTPGVVPAFPVRLQEGRLVRLAPLRDGRGPVRFEALKFVKLAAFRAGRAPVRFEALKFIRLA